MILTHQKTNKPMLSFKFLNLLLNPKILFGVLLFDLTNVSIFLKKYIFSDWSFLKWLIIVMILDLITGVTKIWVNEGLKSITSRGLRDTVSKIIQYGAFLIVTHVLTHFEIGGQVYTDYNWINKIAYEFLIFIEIKSVYENIIKINPKLDFITYLKNKIGDLAKK